MFWIAWLVIIAWSLPPRRWPQRLSAILHGAPGKPPFWRVAGAIAGFLSDLACAAAMGWLMHVSWLASVLCGGAYYLVRRSIGDSLKVPGEQELELMLDQAWGEHRQILLRSMEQRRQLEISRGCSEEARGDRELFNRLLHERLPADSPLLPRKTPSPPLTRHTRFRDACAWALFWAVYCAVRTGALVVLIWLIHSLALI